MGMTGPVSWLAGRLSSSAELSPFLRARLEALEGFLGKRVSLEWHSFGHGTWACRDSLVSVHLLRSIQIPAVRATFLWMPATLGFSKLQPLPCQLAFGVVPAGGHLTMGPMGPEAGRRSRGTPWLTRPCTCSLPHRLNKPQDNTCLPVLVEVQL